MKVAIVTVYNSPNYGAFLQAYALKTALEKNGHEVSFLDVKSRNVRKILFEKWLKRTVVYGYRRGSFGFYWNCGTVYIENWKKFATCSQAQLEEYDMVIFGSDEIWNIKRKQIRNYPVLWGTGVKNMQRSSYAVSINAAEVDDFLNCNGIAEELGKFNVLSVRDEHSRQVLEEVLLRNNIQVVADPTMLFGKEFYSSLVKPVELDKFILVYSYGNLLTDEIIHKIRKYADEKNMKLVSLPDYAEWCDYNIPCDPFQVLWLFLHAEMVFTDTFHGTVFSIIFQKQFHIISKASNKVKNLLNQLELGYLMDKYENNEKSDLDEKWIAYDQVEKKMHNIRYGSWQVLKQILDGSKDE